MADDDAIPGDVVQDDLPVDRGECPICGVEFDDADVFREHLAEVHDLHDEEGATTSLWIPTFAVDPIEDVEPTIPDDNEDGGAPVAPALREKAPVGLIVLVVLLIVFGGGLVLFIQSNKKSDKVADAPIVSTGGTTPSGAPAGADGATGASTADATGSSSPGASSGDNTATGSGTPITSGSPGATVPVTETSPSSTVPVTTAPAPTFVAPTTSAAKVDSCSRDHGDWIVTYSWKYVGGSAWSPLSAYTSVGGGRYQHTVSLAANGHAQITSVGVVDSNGKRVDIALSPALSANSC